MACVLLRIAEFIVDFGLALGEDENWEDVLDFVLALDGFFEFGVLVGEFLDELLDADLVVGEGAVLLLLLLPVLEEEAVDVLGGDLLLLDPAHQPFEVDDGRPEHHIPYFGEVVVDGLPDHVGLVLLAQLL